MGDLQVNGNNQANNRPPNGGAPPNQNRIPPSKKNNNLNRPSGVDVHRENDNDGMTDIMSPDNKKKKKDDWNYLK